MFDNWPMIGRDQQLHDVNRLLVTDRVRGVALTGGPGVGTSLLARAVVRAAAEAGWTVRRTAATATSRTIPFGAFAQWTDDLGGTSSALARRVADALIAGTRPDRLLILVDDAHLLDDLSALVLHLLVHSYAAKVVITLRTGEAAPAAVTALSKDGVVRRYDVGPLTRRQSDELLNAVFEVVPDAQCGDEIWRLTRGNVLYLRRLVEQKSRNGSLLVEGGCIRWLGDTAITGSLADLVDQQVGAVGDAVCDVVDVVAVAESIDWQCLRSIVRQEAIEEAEQRGLISISGDDVVVGHPMYAEVRRTRSGSARLRRLRGQVALAMNDGASPTKTAKRGLLWLDSDLPPDPHVLSAAARAASSLLDFTAAERLFTATDGTGVAPARLPPSRSADVNGVIMRASKLLWAKRSPDLSWTLIDEALETAHGVHRQQLLVFRAGQLALAARPAEVLATMAEIDVDALAPFGAVMGFGVQSMAAGELGHPERSAAMAVRAYRVLDATDQGMYLRLPVTEFHTFALAAGGHLAEAVEVAGRHLRSSHADSEPARVVAAEIFGMAALAAGDLDTALTHLPDEASVEAADRFHVANSFHRFTLLRAQALARAGDVDAADRALEVAHAHRHPAYVYVTSLELLTEAWLAAARMRLAEARCLAQLAADFARHHDQFAREVWCLQSAVQFDATDAAGRLEELAAHVEGPRVTIAARYAGALGSDDADGLVF